MKNRKKRVDLIVDLIRNRCIGSQEELAHILADEGHIVTQATLSRDLKMLRTTKIPTDRGTYMYVLPDSNSLKDRIMTNGVSPAKANYQSGFLSLRFSSNIAIIKTRTGYAAGLGYELDMKQSPFILGTVAGTDTLIVIMSEELDRLNSMELLKSMININENQIL